MVGVFNVDVFICDIIDPSIANVLARPSLETSTVLCIVSLESKVLVLQDGLPGRSAMSRFRYRRAQ